MYNVIYLCKFPDNLKTKQFLQFLHFIKYDLLNIFLLENIY